MIAPGPAQAACVPQPNLQAPEGTHWGLYYYRAESRYCWLLVDAAGHEVTVAPAPPAAATPEPPSALQTLFGSFTGGLPPPPPPALPQEPPVAVSPVAPPARLVHANKPGHPVRSGQKGETQPEKHEMTPEERQALFSEFLRWHEGQRITGGLKPLPQ
jgi:hypothetical protein